MQKKYVCLGVVALVAVVAAASMAGNANRPGLKTSKDAPSVRISIPTDLPPVNKLPQQVSLEKATSVLQFDDGSCESGLGLAGTAGTIFTSTFWNEFDVPTQCVMGGLQIVQATARINSASTTNVAQAALFGQAAPTPPSATAAINAGLSGPFNEDGSCPGNQTSTRGASATVTGTSNFWFGVQAAAFIGRDTDGVLAGRSWIVAGPGGNVYSPTDLAGFGFPGNWMLRVTVEDTDCIPAELEGACCLTETDCQTLSAGDCSAGGGLFKGVGVECTADPFELCESLYVTMQSMSAVAQGDGVAISWTTEQEVDTAGFRVLREDIVSTGREKGNRMWSIVAFNVAAQGSALDGSSYEIFDRSPQAQTAIKYRVQDIDFNGKITDHGEIIVDRGSRTSGRSR